MLRMTEKKRDPKYRGGSELERTLTEILVADRRSTEPFIKTFTAVAENVSSLDLGMLVGVFEVDEKSEDAAYIVNFLASVAKKEYFNNPRRGAIESFEAALHKVNVALAELVKHGNIAWLGKLHGALAVLEKNSFHFSVTGSASILLLRQGTMSDISEGLASSEAENHPLKTFVEVSSGRLMPLDAVILATPELRALFSLEHLAKQAGRMGEEGFLRFLRTALVNELDMAAAIVVNVGEQTKAASAAAAQPRKPAAAKAVTADTKHVANVFSEQTFKKPPAVAAPAEPAERSPAVEEKNGEEYIDSKTGHIYVQGDIFEEASPRQAIFEKMSHLLEGTQAGLSGLKTSLRRASRKGSKSVAFGWWRFNEKGKEVLQQGWRASRRRFQRWQQERQLAKASRKEALAEKASPLAAPAEATLPEISTPFREETLAQPSFSSPEPQISAPAVESAPTPPPSFPKRSTLQSKLSRFYAKEASSEEEDEAEIPDFDLPPATGAREQAPATPQEGLLLAAKLKQAASLGALRFRTIYKKTKRSLRKLAARASFLKRLPPKKYLLWVGVGATVLVGSGWLFLRDGAAPITENDSFRQEEVVQPAGDASGAQPSLANGKSFPIPGGLRGLVVLDHIVYAATPTGLLEVESGIAHAAPLQGGQVRFIAAMDDLKLIFLLTDQNQLITWSPLSKTFNQNTLPLPAGAAVKGIGTYLTYLYVLDSQNDQIYRFPRTEGGFGEPTNWLRSSVALEDSALFAVNETIALAPTPEALSGFFQGRKAGDFSPAAIRALYSQSDTNFLYALSGNGEEVFIWDLERHLRQTYHLEDPQETAYIAADPENSVLYVGDGETSVLRFSNVKP